ncbi:MAG TPA: monovalent cation/H+ antiporter complex subunit F [Wenzhouxiangella sp.]|nr:monovalent cation/H+ antiporter complex subunit F [Wenzhouxiangella sp.]
MIYTLAALTMLATMALALTRALLGPQVWDRIVAVNVFGTKTVLLVALISFVMGHDLFIDVALVYALINFIAIIAVLKLVRLKDPDEIGREGEEP